MIPTWARRGRAAWQHAGQRRPEFAVSPEPGQESVWDYPRPPRLDLDAREVVVRVGDLVIAESRQCIRVLETASPPTVYLPPDDVQTELLVPAPGGSRCEWKGEAQYRSIVLPQQTLDSVAWSYAKPFAEFEAIQGYVSFYPARVECYIDGERVQPQPGRFYGGWVTSEIVGPFKGEPGSEAW